MTPELQRYYEDRLTMTSSQGWRDMVEDVQAMLNETNKIDSVDTVEKLHFRKGEISIMRWILSLAEVSEAAYNQLKEGDDA